MKINLPNEVISIIDQLQESGYSAHVVGGCVRDSLLGRKPEDWDITTSAKPEEVKKLFQKTIDTGLQHGTVTILIDNKSYEVTTYRIDGKYLDNRRPESVEYTQDLIEDLKRRDFTINAMAYNNEDGLVDVFDGIKDLKEGIIKCVGNPIERFNEDALRMLRAIRFAAQLSFKIEQNTEIAIKKLSRNINNISAERILVELTKLLISNNPQLIKKLYELNLLENIIPEFLPCFETEQENPHHMYNVGDHTLKTLGYIEGDAILRWTMLFHDIGKPAKKTTDKKGIAHFYGHAEESSILAERILKRLKADNKTITTVKRLIIHHDYRYKVSSKTVRKAIFKVGEDIFPLLLKVQKADVMAQSEYMKEEKLLTIEKINEIYKKIIEENQCVSIKQLEITGKDIIALGINEGKHIGETLNFLINVVLEDPEKNNTFTLLELAKKKLNIK
ncbi:tRNA nucleotidyltransferase (CCA-adding enzyme) [Natranaerovirga pectinivora]|uniref:tRNA nucleotidyltransferase (CCA-adding enzyme) n=1 Tax=Natranaerovirga pectinivora TaxID=682400 RepID=A0A4R3MKF2_9FIRM|nr:CCA tRNA nucleotidyltransferase [Natranaerovirga pectinivora]TCT13945.1 tRNA nucleotidyltransferase (CCA-adding enzyme) [Natranaerovirga pectinivora]